MDIDQTINNIEAATKIQLFLLGEKLPTISIQSEKDNIIKDVLVLTKYIQSQCVASHKAGLSMGSKQHTNMPRATVQPLMPASHKQMDHKGGFDRMLVKIISPEHPIKTESIRPNENLLPDESLTNKDTNSVLSELHHNSDNHSVTFNLSRPPSPIVASKVFQTPPSRSKNRRASSQLSSSSSSINQQVQNSSSCSRSVFHDDEEDDAVFGLLSSVDDESGWPRLRDYLHSHNQQNKRQQHQKQQPIKYSGVTTETAAAVKVTVTEAKSNPVPQAEMLAAIPESAVKVGEPVPPKSVSTSDCSTTVTGAATVPETHKSPFELTLTSTEKAGGPTPPTAKDHAAENTAVTVPTVTAVTSHPSPQTTSATIPVSTPATDNLYAPAVKTVGGGAQTAAATTNGGNSAKQLTTAQSPQSSHSHAVRNEVVVTPSIKASYSSRSSTTPRHTSGTAATDSGSGRKFVRGTPLGTSSFASPVTPGLWGRKPVGNSGVAAGTAVHQTPPNKMDLRKSWKVLSIPRSSNKGKVPNKTLSSPLSGNGVTPPKAASQTSTNGNGNGFEETPLKVEKKIIF